MFLFLIAIFVLTIMWWLLAAPSRMKDMAAKIPGPRAYPIVGNIFNIHLAGQKAIDNCDGYIKKYGTTFRYWIGSQLFVLITEPDDMQMILSSQSLLTKGLGYNTLKNWLGSGLLISKDSLWHMRRKAITPTFHFKILGEFVPIFNKCARTLADCVKDKVGKGPFYLTTYMSNCALDAIAETAMGTSINAQTNPLDHYPSSIMRMTQLLSEKVYNPFLAMEPIYTLSGRRQVEKNILKILFTLPLQVIDRKKKELANKPTTRASKDLYDRKKKTAFLELLLQMKEENCVAFKSDQDIKDEVVTFMFAGHDTTTMALSFTIWLLGLHPEIQEELYNEVSAILGEDEPSMESYQKMKYLDRVIKESLRLYPPVPAMSRMLTKDIVLPHSQYAVPKGAQIMMFIYPMHRREELFPNANKFDPDRFLKPLTHPFSYLPFSAGSRNCIGQKYAMLDLKVVISNFVLKYKIHSEGTLQLNREFLLRGADGPYVSLTMRN